MNDMHEQLSQKAFSRELLEIGYFVLFYVVIAGGLVGLVAFLSLGGQESDTYYKLVTFYWIFGILGLILLIALKIGYLVTKRSPEFRRRGSAFFSFIFDPERSILSTVTGFRWLNKFWDAFVIQLTFFTLLNGVVGTIANVAFLARPKIQQILPSATAILEAEPAASGETLLILGLVAAIISILYYVSVKNKWSYTTFFFVALLVAFFFSGFIGLGIHEQRYGSDEVALGYTFQFWGRDGALMVLTGSILGPWLDHFTNNVFAHFSEKYQKDLVVLYEGVGIGLLNIFYWGLIRPKIYKKQGRALYVGEGVS